MDKPEIIKRSYEFEIRAGTDQENGTYITGKPIVYEKAADMGYFEEIIERGALDGTKLDDVRFLVNHNTNMIPLARSKSSNKKSTMQLGTTDGGMEIRVNLDTENNAEAKALYSAVQRGDITSMSFMFTIKAEKWERMDTDYPLRRIQKIDQVFEVSAVTFPAYEATEINARSKETLESARNLLTDKEKRAKDLELEKEKIKILYM